MKLAPYEALLSEPLAFWLANADAALVPEVVRCTGLAPLTDFTHLTAFFPETFGRQFMKNLNVRPNLTLLGCSVPTYESYQYKGLFRSLRPCTEAEVALQHQYLDGFTDTTAAIGFSKEGFFKSYFHQPSYAVTFEVLEVFEQTPYKGTGNLVRKKEELHG